LTPLCGESVEKYFDEILNVTKAASSRRTPKGASFILQLKVLL